MSILKYKDPKTGEFKRINPYKADLSFVGKDGIVVNKAADKEQIEISGKGCVPIDTRNTGLRRAYTVNETGKEQIMMPIKVDAYPTDIYSLVRRDGNVSVHGLVPDSPTDTVLLNKKYVDDNYVAKVKFTNLEQALNGYILDTTKEAYADLDSAVLKNSVAVGNNVYPIADKTRALVTRIEGKTTKMVQLLDKSVIPATTTLNGITYTNNNDGSITINGTATAESYIIIVARDKVTNGNKILYGSEQNTSDYGVSWGTNLHSSKFTTSKVQNNYTVKVNSGVTVDNVKIYPQLFDLTAMNREDITTVEQFKAEFSEFYPYENGNIYPAKISGVKFTGKNLFNPSTPKYSGQSVFELDGNNITVNQSISSTYISANFELPNAKFLIGKKISISAKVKTSDNNRGTIRVLWMRGNAAVNTPGMEIISNSETGETERNLSASGIVSAPSDDALKLCLLLYSNADGNLSETKTYTVTYSNIQVEISDAPTAYEPYTEPVSVTLPETYDLHGIGDYKDYLEITKNENNELYTLKKVQVVEKKVLDGTETINKSGYSTTNYQSYYITTILLYVNNGLGGICNKLPTAINTKDIAHVTFGINNTYPYLFLDKETYTTEDSVKAYLAAQYAANDPLIIYYIRQTPVETVIATNLTYEQVTAIRHNGGLIEVEGNINKGYARPTVTNTIVYRLTAANTAEG